jgi:hypothetical protein
MSSVSLLLNIDVLGLSYECLLPCVFYCFRFRTTETRLESLIAPQVKYTLSRLKTSKDRMCRRKEGHHSRLTPVIPL